MIEIVEDMEEMNEGSNDDKKIRNEGEEWTRMTGTRKEKRVAGREPVNRIKMECCVGSVEIEVK